MEPIPESFKMYSLEEVAAILGVSVRTMHTYVKTGKIKAVKIGGSWKVSTSNLQKFVDGE